MTINAIFKVYHQDLIKKYRHKLRKPHYQALQAFLRCRTKQSGQMQLHCNHCDHYHFQPLSCGNRHCSHCQHHENSRWLDRQTAKLLPVPYFMATFTLPFQYRNFVWHHQKVMYKMLIDCAVDTLRTFARNDKILAGELAMSVMLHTHTRRLDFHPHCHIIIPGGVIDKCKREWRPVKGHYLFNEFALAKVFRAKLLAAIAKAKLTLPMAPSKWVVDCRSVGKGTPALQYLSRYLYRGVLSDKAIKFHRNGRVCFSYIDSKTQQTKTREVSGVDFCWLVLQHVLPKRFRRVRDYGFLHGNAKKWLQWIQLLLRVILPLPSKKERPAFPCPLCKHTMIIVGFIRSIRRYKKA